MKSLQRGNQDDNTIAELQKRLEALPKDLHKLYESMWRRLNDDEPIYREDGARLLNYALEWARFGPDDPIVQTCSVAQLTLAREAALRQKILKENYCPSADEWALFTKKTIKQSRHALRGCSRLLHGMHRIR